MGLPPASSPPQRLRNRILNWAVRAIVSGRRSMP
jgi:hypothetical protein